MKGPDRITIVIQKLNSDDFEYPLIFDDAVSDLTIRSDPYVSDKDRVFFYDSEQRKVNSFEITKIDLENCKQNLKSKNVNLFNQNFRQTRVLLLDASSRFDLAKSLSRTDPRQDNGLPLLQDFCQKPKSQDKLQEVFQTAFHMSIILDRYTPGLLSFKVGGIDDFDNSAIPKDYDKLIHYMKNFPYLDEQGDGFKSFVGIIVSILTRKNRIILIDEPEAFLHSTQAKILGRWIIQESLKSNNQIIMATHSPAFVDSFSRFEEVNILRVERNNDMTRFTQLKPATINKFNKDPILSNLSMLDSVFYYGVILCEGDRDRVVHRAAYNKLINQNEDILFINTNGKQGIKNVIPILKETEIKFRIITDFDLLLNKSEFFKVVKALDKNSKLTTEIIDGRNAIDSLIYGDSESKIVSSLCDEISIYINSIKTLEDKSVRQFKDSISRLVSQSKAEQIKKYGLKGFGVNDRRKVGSLLNKCKLIGLYLAPYGEVENFIPIKKRKDNWLSPALERISNGLIPKGSIKFLTNIDRSIRS